MDFLRLSQFGSFIETISPDDFDVSIIVSDKKRCAMGWAPLFDERVVVWENVSVKWTPTNEWGYAIVAIHLFEMTETQARQLFQQDLHDTDLLPWVKTRRDAQMTPKDMAERIRDFIEYFEAHPEPELIVLDMDITKHDPDGEPIGEEVIEPLPQEPAARPLTPLEILGL